MKGRMPSSSGAFGCTDTGYCLAGLDRYARFPHTAFAKLWNPACGYQAVEAVRRRSLRRFECLFDPTCHCDAGFVVSLETRRTVEYRTYFTQFSQWNSNSSRAVFDLMFLSFLEIVTSDTVEDLLYKAWYRSQMASLHAVIVCTCRASCKGATEAGKGYEIEKLPWLLTPSPVLFKIWNPVGESGHPSGRGGPFRQVFGGRFSCSGG